MPKVTVLMPLNNGINDIEEALQAIQTQTFKDWELIVVNDDGSNDGCADIVRRYTNRDPRIKLIQAEERLGFAASLNLGLDIAAGEYIALTDITTFSLPERLDKQVAFLDSNSATALCSCWQKIRTPEGQESIVETETKFEELQVSMIFGCEIVYSGVMLRKEVLDSNNWRFNTACLSEDYEMWTKMLSAGANMANLPEPLVYIKIDSYDEYHAENKARRNDGLQWSKRVLRELGVRVDGYDSMLFSDWQIMPKLYAQKNYTRFLQQGFNLLQELLDANQNARFYNQDSMFSMVLRRWDWVRESCGLEFHVHAPHLKTNTPQAKIVSVVLPAYNAAVEISRAIDSVIEQTYTSWEMLVVNDFGSDDGTAEIVRMYALRDPRIRLLEPDSRLGLAESLNLGMQEAAGTYIARIDADDTALPERFAKQVAFLERNPDIGLCGTWQYHYGKESEWIHKAEPEPEKLKCKLLFWCDVCHSTVMLRKESFLQNGLLYDSDAQAEDFELWTRALPYVKMANLSEVLGTYNESTGITTGKQNLLNTESGEITARTLKNILKLDLNPEEIYLLNSWDNPLSEGENREQELAALRDIITRIWAHNNIVHFFDKEALLQVLAAKWFWTKDQVDWKYDYSSIQSLEDIFLSQYKPTLIARYRLFRDNNPQPSVRAKKIVKRSLRPLADVSRRITKGLMRDVIIELDKDIEQWTWSRYKRLTKDVERWTWERYKRQEGMMKPLQPLPGQVAELQFLHKQLVADYDTKIRIVFLYQVASFWPSWESFYGSVLHDERFDVRFLFLDETVSEHAQMKGAQEFLDKRGIDYINFVEFDMDAFAPHVIVIQSPYDRGHRLRSHWASTWRSKGYRVVYIPYGIEISDTNKSHYMHFEQQVIENAWKVYTLSEVMKRDYNKYCSNAEAVTAIGHPRFDAFFHREQFPLDETLRSIIAGRKICLWKVHFPKIFNEKGVDYFATPDLHEYLEFASYISSHPEIFFIFMPHPRFLEPVDNKKDIQALATDLVEKLRDVENVYIDTADDYRTSLINADFIIVDRSAVMIDAGAVGVPVLYMRNEKYEEPLTNAVAPLVNSYAQGENCRDMIDFVEACLRGEDSRKEIRAAAFNECVPSFDGRCGERIKEDIIQSIRAEDEKSMLLQLASRLNDLEAHLSSIDEKLSEIRR